MAEAVFRDMLSKRVGCDSAKLREHGWDVFSAGVAAFENQPASTNSIQALNDRGIDLSDHLSRQVTATMLESSDRIYTMTRNHLNVLHQAKPELQDRMTTLSAQGDISDPIGGSPELYDQCAEQIATCLQVVLDDLLKGNPSA